MSEYAGAPILRRLLIFKSSAQKEEVTVDHLVVTLVAPDKPGQVERIAQCIA